MDKINWLIAIFFFYNYDLLVLSISIGNLRAASLWHEIDAKSSSTAEA